MSRTGQLADWSTHGQLLPTAVLSCYVSVGILQVAKHFLSYFAPLPGAHEIDDADDEIQQNVVCRCFFVSGVIRELTSPRVA